MTSRQSFAAIAARQRARRIMPRRQPHPLHHQSLMLLPFLPPGSRITHFVDGDTKLVEENSDKFAFRIRDPQSNQI